MSISYKEASELLAALQEIEIPEKTSSDSSITGPADSPQTAFMSESGLNITALSLESCDAQELMHCYQLALEFGVPTARRALALYQSRASTQKEN
jgi:hypothetical protein